MNRLGPTGPQRFSALCLIADLLSNTKDVLDNLAWYPEIVARHFRAASKLRDKQSRQQAKASAQIEALSAGAAPPAWYPGRKDS